MPDRAHQAALKTQIVIVGGGAGGLELATKLGKRFGRRNHDIILIERHRTHVWKPLLHEVATGALDANIDEVGYREHCSRWGYRFFYGVMSAVDTKAQEVEVAPLKDSRGREIIGAHRIRYDYLVLAYGSVTNDFGTPGVRDNCLFLDSRHEADEFRERLLDQCLRVSRTVSQVPDSDARVRVAVVGGGATGVELSAELFNAADGLGYYGLETFDARRLDVTLIEAGPRILPALPERLADGAKSELEKLGARVLTGKAVTRVTEEGMVLADGEIIPAELKVWAAGVKGTPIAGTLGDLELARSNQIVVRPTLQVAGHDNIFAIGDCAFCAREGDRPVPPRAQAAHQMASCAFQNLVRLMKGEPLKPFVYRDHGSLVSLSRYSTVGSLMGALVGGALAIEGRIARFVYASLYRMHLIAIHGWIKGMALIVVGRVNAVVRPRLKLH